MKQGAHWAAFAGGIYGHGDRNIEVVRVLIKAGADPSLVREDGETPAQTASRNDNKGIALYLKKFVASQSYKNEG